MWYICDYQDDTGAVKSIIISFIGVPILTEDRSAIRFFDTEEEAEAHTVTMEQTLVGMVQDLDKRNKTL